MLTVYISAPNMILFDTRVEFFYIDKNNFIPFGHCKIDSFLETINSFDIKTIIAEYHTTDNPKARKRDFGKYTKRLQVLDQDWTYTPWEYKKIEMHVMYNILQSTLIKKEQVNQ